MSVKHIVTYIVYAANPYHLIFELHSKDNKVIKINLIEGTKTSARASWNDVQAVINKGTWRYIDKKDLKQYALECALSGMDVNYIFED